MVFDIEFVSEGRYIPELSLLQLAWGDVAAPEIAVIDCLAADPAPILELIAGEQVETVAHAARQDLGLLAARHGVVARAFWDTQIAAAFLGIAEQIGYGRLVAHMLGVDLDKGAQFTAWLERPLSERQLRYAVDDVRYLPRIWAALRADLQARGRLGWVREESDRLAAGAMPYGPAEEAYLDIKGGRGLRGRALASLQALAAWRQTQALAENKPLSWVLPEPAMIELCKRVPRELRDVRAVRGIGEGTVRRYGADILAVLTAAARQPPPPASPPASPLGARAQMWAPVLAALIQALAARAGIASRFVGTRGDAEALAAWFDEGARGAEPDIQLLAGWRRELAGEAVLAWLRGERAIIASHDGEEALALVDAPGTAGRRA